MKGLSALGLLCGISFVYWGFDERAGWDPSRPGDYTWVNVGLAVGCFVLSYVLWQAAEAREALHAAKIYGALSDEHKAVRDDLNKPGHHPGNAETLDPEDRRSRAGSGFREV
jgi:hypothetical protein